MGLKHGGKTRTSSSHGPIQAKRQSKHDAAALVSKQATKSRSAPSSTSATTSGMTNKRRSMQDDGNTNEDKASTRASTRLLNAPDDIDFPRGGGTSLTQAEVREQQLAGQREAVAAIKADRKDVSGDIDGSQSASRPKAAKRRKIATQSKFGESSTIASANGNKDAFRVEHLNYKRLVVGTKVLCQVISVRSLELIVSLPGQLLGHVPVTNISTEFTKRLEQDDDEDHDSMPDEDGSSSTSDVDVPALQELFRPGMWLPAVVTGNASSNGRIGLGGFDGDENVRASRRIELSIEPEKVNEGMAHGDLKPGTTLAAAVRSIEDHGFVMSFGLPSMASFLSLKDATKLQHEPLEVGQVVVCRIKSISENGRTSTVSVDPVEVRNSSVTHAASVSSILPSSLVNVLVTASLPSGLNVKLFGFFDGSIDLDHLDGLDPQKDFKTGQKLKARVLWSSLSDTPKRFALSIAKHVLSLADAVTHDAMSASLADSMPIGRVIDNVIITRVDDEWGLSCEIHGSEGAIARGFVHISRISDDHLVTVPKGGPWRAGTTHRARVVGHSPVDGLVQLSLQQSVLDKTFLKVADVKGIVKRLTDSAMFVSIGGNVDGVVWPLHYSDVRLRHPERKFKAGTPVKARVFSVDAAKNRVTLTLKKQLVSTESAIPNARNDIRPDLVTPAVVTKVLDKAILVDFFGGSRGLVPASEVAQNFIVDLAQTFEVGRVVLVRILSADADGRVVASIRQATTDGANTVPASQATLGSLVSGKVTALHDANAVLELSPGHTKALMSFATLARHRGVSATQIKATLNKGDTIDDLVIVSKNEEKGLVIVGPLPNATTARPETGSQASWSTLVAGQAHKGKIVKIMPTGILVQLARAVRGKADLTELRDDFDQVHLSLFKIGQEVDCQILSVDVDHKRLELSLRSSKKTELQDAVNDPAVRSLDDVTEGQTKRGFVRNIAKQGLFVQLGSDITARVQIKNLFDEYVKDWQSRFQVGQLVSGRIIAVDKVQHQVEMSLKSNMVNKKDQPLGNIRGLSKGQVVNGVVKRIETFGVFVRLDEFGVSGLCHKSKVTDDDSVEWTSLFHEGDEVRAVVTDIDFDKNKVSLALKASMVDQEPQTSLASGDDDLDADSDLDGDDEMLTAADPADSDENEYGVTDDEEDQDEDEEDQAVSDDGSESEDNHLAVANGKMAEPLLNTNGFAWTGEAIDDDAAAQSAEEASDGSDNERSDQQGDLSVEATRSGDAPQTQADFERLLLSNTNSSFIWIQFISFYVGLSQLDKARDTARRALKSINFREEEEKLNVWTAMLNLEHAYGDEQTLEKTFKEATQMNDAKKIYQRMLEIRSRASEHMAEDELYQKFVRKFSTHSDVWTSFAQFYLRQGRAEEARALLPRSLKSLDKRDHVETISKFAQLEFKLGDAERGRTIFEGIVDSYPKRLDLWLVYIDQEIKQNNVAGVRALFDRLLQQRLSSKKGKSVFKKWLAFEKEHGDETGADTVKQKALLFVESLATPRNDDHDEVEEER
ncbi:rRNA biogenesis protein rrp5 [Microbotryomycetes sp. JL221]|nr:rRNA biogenesis protein rrp5 [Microbotryomycetes sp. JL221]